MHEKPDVDFKSPEELGRLLNMIGGRLHYINRVTGESHFRWHLAEVIRAAGQLASLMDDKEIARAFGDGYTPGSLDETAQTDRMLSLLEEHLRR